jgi:hypothetical protein
VKHDSGKKRGPKPPSFNQSGFQKPQMPQTRQTRLTRQDKTRQDKTDKTDTLTRLSFPYRICGVFCLVYLGSDSWPAGSALKGGVSILSMEGFRWFEFFDSCSAWSALLLVMPHSTSEQSESADNPAAGHSVRRPFLSFLL